MKLKMFGIGWCILGFLNLWMFLFNSTNNVFLMLCVMSFICSIVNIIGYLKKKKG